MIDLVDYKILQFYRELDFFPFFYFIIKPFYCKGKSFILFDPFILLVRSVLLFFNLFIINGKLI